ncbi:beta-lactamase/transpeptidase-like protein, partial [Colletotrichum eremochloae]
FRGQFDYSNWHYTVAGEVTEQVSGQTYGEYISAAIADRLGLHSTTAIHSSVPESRVAKPYAALDNLDFYQLPRPQAQSGAIMGPAQRVLSSVNDLLSYASAMMSSAAATDSERPKLRGMQKQLAGHVFTAMSTRESSYGLGLFRHQLPGVVSGTGANGMFVKQLPILVPGENTRLVISHPGSLAGYTSFFAMLPEIDVGVVVLTNSIGLADPSAWIGHVLLEALVETPSPVDVMQFVEEAAQSHIQSYPKLQETFAQLRGNSTPPETLQDYTGVYQFDGDLDFKIVIRLTSQGGLQVVFQNIESQTWDLQFLEGETFHWLTSRDDQAKKAKFTY